jgi:hypothetical protein
MANTDSTVDGILLNIKHYAPEPRRTHVDVMAVLFPHASILNTYYNVSSFRTLPYDWWL